MTRTWPCFLAVCLALSTTSQAQSERPPFAWRDGDRVVLIGDTFLEREQTHGYLETLIVARNHDKTITFRNLGWSGDDVQGLSRSGFGKADEGYRQLRAHVTALKPTVLILGYGMAESFRGAEGIPGFLSRLNQTLDAVKPPDARLIILSPIAHEDLGRPLPDPARHNEALALYRDALRELAEKRGAWFVDLYEPVVSAHDYGIDPLTDNGIHPTAYGYWYLASVIDMELRDARRDPGWEVRIDPSGRAVAPRGVAISELVARKDGLRFRILDPTLPIPPAPKGAPAEVIWSGTKRALRIAGLEPGTYDLSIDGQRVATATDDLWGKGVRLDQGPEFDQVEALRREVNAKNQLYFHRWRPQNETYLFGFRKHEQGNNAREIPLFDPLVEAREKAMAKLKAPVPRVYELTRSREGEVSR